MFVREETVLQPRKASNQNPDNWPQFNFKQVTITSLKTGQDASLLSAHQHNPLKVTGRVEAIDDDLMHLGEMAIAFSLATSLTAVFPVRDRSYTNKTINLEQVTRYAFAEYDDGSCGFWAAGKAGWFEIQSPASPFKTTYEKMNEAASIFYMLADRLRRTHRRARNLGPKELKIHARKVFQAVGSMRPRPTP